jgi:class 3 adenylate cyclase/tetratricopeptide (TPR) repeat protein
MSEQMDAEDVTEVMNDVWARLDDVVIEHGGRIDKHIGDALMGIWGSEGIHEDDPEQAVRAALGLHAALAQFRNDSGLGLRMRTGVNTGPAVLGSVGSTGEFTAMGDTVNVASRLEQAAPPDGVLISHDTYRHVRGVFDVESQKPLLVKGKTEPLRTYLILAAKPRAFRSPSRGVEGVETRMVGRDTELASICATFDAVVSWPAAHLVTVLGEAGVGKSRLLWEFDNWLDLQPLTVVYFKGRALPQRRDVPLALLRDVIASRFEIVDSDPAASVLANFAAATAEVLERDEAAALALWLGFDVAGLPGVPDGVAGERLAIAGRTYLTELVRFTAARAPVVLLLEDLHWADDDSLAFLHHLFAELADSAILVVAAARPELLAVQPDWAHACRRGDLIELGPLTTQQTRLLVREILRQAGHVPAQLEDLVVDRADGNSFYVEEIVQMLIDDRVIDTTAGNGVWAIDIGRLDADRIPPTLVGVLQARLDALPIAARASLQSAAVIGRIFWDTAVEALSDAPPHLDSAINRELVFARRPAAFAGCEEYIFKHALLHDVAYETVLLADRPRLHSRAAEWLDRHAGHRRDEYLVDIARHHQRAGTPVAAAEALDAAVHVALHTGSPQSARRLADEALDLWRVGGIDPPIGALTRLAMACTMLGDLTTAQQESLRAIEFARADGEPTQLVEALDVAAQAAEKLGDYDRRRALLEEALPIAEQVGGIVLGKVLVALAWSAFDAGEPERANQFAARGLALARGDAELTTRASHISAAVAQMLGDSRASERHSETAVAVSHDVGDLVGEAIATSNLGVIWHFRGDDDGAAEHYRTARRHYLTSLGICERLGMREYEATALSNLAQVSLRLDDIDAAESLSRRSLTVAMEIGARPAALAALLVHAEALIAAGDRTGLGLIGLVQRQSSIGDTRYEVDRILDRLRAVGTVRIEEGLASGELLDFDEVVQHILFGPPSPND